ncbi:MAG: ribokinase [Sneathiellales bacterium]|nr:ribokinase [Sneathiellales bacterium]
MTKKSGVVVLGIFVADTTYLAERMPVIGETLMGRGFSVGPGGKGSNQAVAAARAGAETTFLSKIGKDTFGELAQSTYRESGVKAQLMIEEAEPTGAAFIYVNDTSGENAIIVYPGAAGKIDSPFIEENRQTIENAKVFVTQMEQPEEAALQALRIAKGAGVTTVFNPAPASRFSPEFFELCDYIVPNETEAEAIVGFPVDSFETAQKAGEILCDKGAGVALITLGEKGVYVHSKEIRAMVPAVTNAPVLDTSGAGDAFIGGFTAALSENQDVVAATRFGCATAGISVSRRGTAPSMPQRHEIDDLLKNVGY